MKIEDLHVGQKVRHPQYGFGIVKAITEHASDILFDDGKRTVAPEVSGLEPAAPQALIGGLSMPLAQFIDRTVHAVIAHLGLEKPDSVVALLGARWHKGKLVMHPADPSLQAKEVPMEVFFHMFVGVRNQLRVL